MGEEAAEGRFVEDVDPAQQAREVRMRGRSGYWWQEGGELGNQHEADRVATGPGSQRSYQMLRPRMRTGDMILWRDGPPLSWVLKRTHVGTVIRYGHYDHDQGETSQDVVFVFESVWRGAVLNELSKRVGTNYQGQAWWHQIQPFLNDDEIQKLLDTMDTLRGLPYERSPLEFLGALFRFLKVSWPWSSRSMFCSENRALLLQGAGILDRHIPADEYSPDHWFRDQIEWACGKPRRHGFGVEIIGPKTKLQRAALR